MKNLQIGDNDLIGNKFNGHDLHLYLNEIGIESNHLIANKPESKDKKTFQIGSKFSKKIRQTMTVVDKHYNLNAATHTLPFDIIYNRLFLEADVVHMHLINNYMFNVNLLPLVTSLKPTVWTLHDPWAMTGHCVYPFDCNKWQSGCGDCPDLNIPFKITKDTSAISWEMKRMAFQNSQLTLIVASKWMEDLVKKSPFFKHCEIHRVPFGINQEIFKPAPIKEAKKNLQIDPDSIVLFFRSQNNIFKGTDLLIDALMKIESKNKITLVTVGDIGGLKSLGDKFHILEFGWISDDNKLAQLYQACDIFIMPSKAEAFGMMVIEAMSCKKPVVVLDGTSLPGVVNAPDIGIVCDRNFKSLRQAIQKLIDEEGERELRGEKSYEYALKEYGSKTYVERMVKVYESAIANHKPSIYRNKVVEQLLKHDLSDSETRINFENAASSSSDEACPVVPDSEKTIRKVYLFGFLPIMKILERQNKFKITLFGIVPLFERMQKGSMFKIYLFKIPILKAKTKYW